MVAPLSDRIGTAQLYVKTCGKYAKLSSLRARNPRCAGPNNILIDLGSERA